MNHEQTFQKQQTPAELQIRMGDVYRIAFPVSRNQTSGAGNSVQYGIRPAIVVSNDINNKYSTTVNVIPLTTSFTKKSRNYPMHVLIPADENLKESVAMLEQLGTVSKDQIVSDLITRIDPAIIRKIGFAFRIQFPFCMAM